MFDRFYADTGMRIQIVRSKRGYTREWLSEKVGISEKFLYEIENGRKGFSALVLFRIAEALQVNCDYLLIGERNRTQYHASLFEALGLFAEDDVEKITGLLGLVYDLKSYSSKKPRTLSAAEMLKIDGGFNLHRTGNHYLISVNPIGTIVPVNRNCR